MALERAQDLDQLRVDLRHQLRELGEVAACCARPETTSSPCAFWRKSPEGSGAPVVSSRLKATPEPDASPLLPNTICCTLTAVPQSSGMRFRRRYSTARSPFQESKTAWIAWRSCSRGSCGNSSPVCASKIRLNVAVSARRSVGVELGVEPHAPLAPSARWIARLEPLALDAAHDVAEHLHEPPVGVPAEALVRGPRDQALDRLVVEARG